MPPIPTSALIQSAKFSAVIRGSIGQSPGAAVPIARRVVVWSVVSPPLFWSFSAVMEGDNAVRALLMSVNSFSLSDLLPQFPLAKFGHVPCSEGV